MKNNEVIGLYRLFCDFCGEEIKKKKGCCYYQIEAIKYQYNACIGEYTGAKYCCERCFERIKKVNE